MRNALCSEHHFQITPTKRTDTTFRDDNIRWLWGNGRMNLRCSHCRLQWRLLLFDGREGLIIRTNFGVALTKGHHNIDDWNPCCTSGSDCRVHPFEEVTRLCEPSDNSCLNIHN